MSRLPLPPQTDSDLRAKARMVGLLEGNGNHCDYLVRLALSTKLSDVEIAGYYRSVTVKGVEGRDLSGTVYANPSASSQGDGSKDVIVAFIDGSHEAGFDLRCH
ncbi:hypothetical protein [Nonomuraea fuscirosea]|uniref:hypothetical protein n=1 Tax=Nonomuraea fuscirosea TaxID=1291556 RepID=UPI003431641B